MSIEKTLVIIKPEHMHLSSAILSDLDRFALRTKTVDVDSVPREVVEEHYSIHKGNDYYAWLVTQFANRPITLGVYQGEDVVNKIMKAAGHKDPVKASHDSIRGKYGTESEAFARSQRRAVANVMHRSSSPVEAVRELKVWGEYLR